LNNVLIILFLWVQWRVTVSLFARVRRRYSGRALAAARAAILGFGAMAVFGFLAGMPVEFGFIRLPGAVYVMSSAAALTYFAVASTALVVSWGLRRIRTRFAAQMDPGRRRFLNAAGGAIVASPLAAIGCGFLARTDFRVHEIDVPIAALPPALEGLRVLHLSDIHLSAFLSERQFARVIDVSNGLGANLAVITGDLISGTGDPLDACIRQLARLRADAGIFGCMGNHERYAGCEAYVRSAAARAGIRFLRGEALSLRFGDATLRLAGVDYQPKAQPASYLRGAEKLLAPGAVNVLLSHSPDVFPVAARQGYQLMLSGHTHGGQVTVEILEQTLNPARFFTPYVHGLYRLGQSAAYVTRGIGTIGIPARIGALPEITVVRLRKA
jgi:hypothetical protein